MKKNHEGKGVGAKGRLLGIALPAVAAAMGANATTSNRNRPLSSLSRRAGAQGVVYQKHAPVVSESTEEKAVVKRSAFAAFSNHKKTVKNVSAVKANTDALSFLEENGLLASPETTKVADRSGDMSDQYFGSKTFAHDNGLTGTNHFTNPIGTISPCPAGHAYFTYGANGGTCSLAGVGHKTTKSECWDFHVQCSASGNTAPEFDDADDTVILNVLEDASATAINGLAASDSDSSQTLEWSEGTGPSKGSTSFSGTASTPASGATPTTGTYTPTSNATGADSFTVTVSDGSESDTLTVNVSITAVNDAPTLLIGSNQSANAAQAGSEQSVNSFASMTDDGDSEATQSVSDYVVSEFSDPNDVVTGVDISNSGVLTYTPASNIEGTATINVQVRDSGGTANGGVDLSSSQTFNIVVDSLAPVSPTVSTPSSAVIVNSANQTVSGTHSENGVTVHLYADSDNNGTADNSTSLGSSVVSGGAWSISASLTADTVHNFVVEALDSSGNRSGASDVPTITEDSTSPANPVVTTPSGAITVDAASQTISGTHTEDGVKVYLYADANNDGVADNSTSLADATVSGNAWSFSASLTADTVHNYVVVAEDDAGNTSSDINVPTVTEDSTAPVAPVVTSPGGAASVNAASQTISGTHTENGVTVHAYIDADNDGAADNSTSLGSAVVSGNAWSFSVSLTADTVNNFVVVAEDGSGKTSTDVDVPTITEDSTAPASATVSDPTTAIIVGASSHTISGSHGEDGVVVHLYADNDNDGTADNSTSLGADTVSGGSWSISRTLTSNSANNYVVRVIDGANNESSDTDVPTITQDNTAPADPVVTTPSGAIIVDAASQTISGTHTENGVKVYLYADSDNNGVADNSTSLADATVSGNAWSLSATLTADTAHNYVVVAEDEVGNTSNDVDVPTVTEDSTAPVVPVVTSPGGAASVNAASQTISGTHTENGVTVHAYIDADNDGAADNSTSLGSATVSANAWSLSVSLTADTVHNLVVVAEDGSGKTSTHVDVPTITEDSTAPANATVSDPATSITVNAGSHTISGSHGEDGVVVHLYADNNNDGTADNSTSLGADTVSGGSWSISRTLTSNSANNYVVRVIDGANNESSDTDVPTITHDNIAPVSPVVTTPSTGIAVDASSETVSGTHSEDGVTVHLYADNNNDGAADNSTSLANATVSGGAWSLSASLTSNAANNFVVVAEDVAGNTSSAADVPTITEDSTPPVSPVVNDPSSAVTVNAASQTISGSHAEDGVNVHVYADANNDGTADNNTSLGSSLVSANTWSISVSLTADTVHNYVVRAIDSVSLESSDVDVPTITEDSVAPASAIVTDPSSATTVNADDYAITGTHGEEGAVVHLYADSNNDGTADNATSLGSSTVSGGNWSITGSLTANLDNNFVVLVHDAAGNISGATDVPTITEDSSEPDAPAVTAPSSDEVVNNDTYTITGTHNDDDATVHLYLDANNDGTADSSSSIANSAVSGGNWSIEVTLTEDTAHNYVVRAMDQVNNLSAATNVPTITEDSQKPAQPVLTSPSEVLHLNADNYDIEGTYVESGVTIGLYLDANDDGTPDSDTPEQSMVVPDNGNSAEPWSFTITLNQNAANNYVLVAEDGANESDPLNVFTLNEDSVAPVLTLVEAVESPTGDSTPDYQFNASEAGDITFNGACGTADDKSLTASGDVTFALTQSDHESELENGEYNNCEIVLTDAAGNESTPLAINTFTVQVNSEGVVTISGLAVDEQMLTALVEDEDGVSDDITYEWKSGEEVVGDDSDTYEIGETDIGNMITVTATYEDDRGNEEEITSEATDRVLSIPEHARMMITDYSNTSGSDAPTLENYMDALVQGVTGLSQEVVDLLNNAVSRSETDDVDTLDEIQTLVDTVLAGQDDDKDGLPNFLEGDATSDTDNDGTLDRDDGDSDNDSIADILEMRLDLTDEDNDGIIDIFDADVDADGEVDEGKVDENLDGVNDVVANLLPQIQSNISQLTAASNSEESQVVEADPIEGVTLDFDGDGLMNHHDLDSDNDGILDIDEGRLVADDDQNGVVGTENKGSDEPVDSDEDGSPDFLDLTSDGSNFDITLTNHGYLDQNEDGVIDDTTDSDQDGIPDLNDGAVGFFGSRIDFDNDGFPDHVDPDDDNDGILDSVENPFFAQMTGMDRDGDGIDDGLDASINGESFGTDANGNGYRDDLEPTDTDGDGIPDFQDLDSDNDGAPDDVDPINSTGSDVSSNSAGTFGVFGLLAALVIATRRRALRVFAVALALSASMFTQANEFRVHGGIGSAFYTPDVSNGVEVTEDTGFAWEIGLGYKFNKEWLLELRYIDQGRAKFNNSGSVEYQSTSLNFQYSLPVFADQSPWSVYVLGGLQVPNSKASRGLNLEADRPLGWQAGVGAEWRWDKRWGVNTEVSTYSFNVTTWMFGINRYIAF